jgi:hypothetical protein
MPPLFKRSRIILKSLVRRNIFGSQSTSRVISSRSRSRIAAAVKLVELAW